jgi:cytochrome oxidase assembly protein ShyY1
VSSTAADAAARRVPRAPAVDPRKGPTVVGSRFRRPASSSCPSAPAGAVWQNLDPARFVAATGVEVLPVMIEATRAPVPDDGLVRDWPAPDFGVEKHRIYMLQWYALAALAIVLWLVVHLWRRAPRADD